MFLWSLVLKKVEEVLRYRQVPINKKGYLFNLQFPSSFLIYEQIIYLRHECHLLDGWLVLALRCLHILIVYGPSTYSIFAQKHMVIFEKKRFCFTKQLKLKITSQPAAFVCCLFEKH